ncbi:MAG: hypothetical protein IMF05_04330, partial [Proteobacteria bacterium]|nr:hypothetical protein [Pseudomonadota bacterium]
MTTTFQAVALLFTAVIAATTFGPAGHAHSPDAGTTMANRTWTVEEMGAEVERYRFRGLRGGGEPPVGGSVVVALSEFFGVGKLWSDLDQPD